MDKHQPLLIVEDSDEDFEATLRAFRHSRVINPLFRCKTGDEALDYLFQRGDFSTNNAPIPGLILLDLNLPGTDGREVLRIVKADPRLRPIPVVVLTTSGYDRDIEECYQAGANSYIQKPVDMSGFIQAIQRLQDYWLGLTILPKSNQK